MRRAAGVIVMVLGALALGCSGDDGAPPGLHVTLQRASAFENQRALQLGLRYDGDHDLQVSAMQLSSPMFEPVPEGDRDARVRGGSPGITMPLPYGEARCGDDGQADGRPELVADIDGQDVRVPIDEIPAGMLAGLHDGECAAAAVLEEVDVRLGDHWEHTAPRTAAGELELVQRHPGVTAAVEEMEGNVIFTVSTADATAPTGAWATVSDDQPSASVGVVVYASRCDRHAIIEYKRTYFLTLWLRLGDQEPVRLDIRAEGDAHHALEQLLADCVA